jgi:hypothetical protein
MSWTFHKDHSPARKDNCFLKDNVEPEVPPRKIDPKNNTLTGLTAAAETCRAGDICKSGAPCPSCGAKTCSCHIPGQKASPFACLPPHDAFPFCNLSLTVAARVTDLLGRIPAADKPNLLTARGESSGGGAQKMQSIPSLGVPAYYWGTNCLHSMNGGKVGILSTVFDCVSLYCF